MYILCILFFFPRIRCPINVHEEINGFLKWFILSPMKLEADPKACKIYKTNCTPNLRGYGTPLYCDVLPIETNNKTNKIS